MPLSPSPAVPREAASGPQARGLPTSPAEAVAGRRIRDLEQAGVLELLLDADHRGEVGDRAAVVVVVRDALDRRDLLRRGHAVTSVDTPHDAVDLDEGVLLRDVEPAVGAELHCRGVVRRAGLELSERERRAESASLGFPQPRAPARQVHLEEAARIAPPSVRLPAAT